MTLNEQLRQAKTAWLQNKNYNNNALPKIKEYNLQYRATGKYPYNSDIALLIKTNEIIDSDLTDYLETEIYLSQQEIRRDNEAIKAKEMLANGYEPLTKELALKAIESNQKLQIKAQLSHDWLTTNVDQVYKVTITNDGKDIFLMKPRKRTRGYYLHSFENAYAKLTK